MQIFTLLFIESASYIDEADPGWELFITFKRETKQCIGYTTTYQFWRYEGFKEFDFTDPKDIKTRAKISQFLILPPYQGKKHGKELYNSVITQWMKQPSVTEITVEDPNESFDDLRDRCDFERLLKQGAFDNLPKDLPMSAGWLASKQSELKLEKRQFMRLFEMHLLYKHSPNFRLQVKKRIYEKNYEALVDMDAENKKDKLQTAFQSVSDDYKRIISKIVSLDKRASPVEHERKTKVAKQ